MTDPGLGQCGWIDFVEDGGDGSACPNPATQQITEFPEGGGMPATGSFCDDHVEQGRVRLREQF
jgi:hypothetical protein